jgi:hypothetical protein
VTAKRFVFATLLLLLPRWTLLTRNAGRRRRQTLVCPAAAVGGGKLVPADAINQLEMWKADQNEIDKHLGRAEGSAQSISIRRSAIFRAALRGRLISVLV